MFPTKISKVIDQAHTEEQMFIKISPNGITYLWEVKPPSYRDKNKSKGLDQRTIDMSTMDTAILILEATL